MRFGFTIVFCIALFQIGIGQYTYFNSVDGVTGDDASEGVTNCEFLGDSFYVWGGGIISGDQQKLLREYDVEATMLNENWLVFSDNYIYSGTTNSFQRIPGEDNFLVSHSLIDANGIHGFLMKVDDELDTLWTRLVDLFPGETYVYTHARDGDGFILAGEHQVAGVGNGTFIAKVDTEGEYMWHIVLHEPEEGSFRNRFISVTEDGYIVSGSQGGGLETEGQIEFYDSSSNELFTLVNNESAISRGIMSHLIRGNGEVIVTQPIRVTDYSGSANPSFAYSKSSLFRLDFVDMELELLAEHNGGGSWITGGAIKTIESSQDGLVQLGRTYLEIDDSLRQISFVMKLTEDYQVDWYTELSYEICSGCVNELYDIEQAPDGGYVMVGKFNSPEDPYDKTWLVKVDACGDLEWQGCEPVGIQELQIQESRLELYPNPASNLVRVTTSSGLGGSEGWQSLSIYNINGKVVMEMFNDELRMSNTSTLFSTSDEVELDISDFGAGLYSVILGTSSGQVYSAKLVVE